MKTNFNRNTPKHFSATRAIYLSDKCRIASPSCFGIRAAKKKKKKRVATIFFFIDVEKKIILIVLKAGDVFMPTNQMRFQLQEQIEKFLPDQ